MRRHKTIPKYLSREQALECLQIAEKFSKELYLMFKVMITTGIRVSDYINLKPENFKHDPTLGYILTFKARKNKQEITAPITEDIYKAARSLKTLFPGTRWTAWNQTRQVGQAMGIKLTPHMLRHTFVVLSRQAGVTWEMIAGITGDDFQTLKDWYHHVDPSEVKAVRAKLESYLFS
ncbi:MAG: tyrosine-type recombinase/integrase [Candidatus Odinarchaeum yellowstonii]|uniref:Tyrosine-type recombinase/integrase n=1 Tax=Odinarchaeota yellowstonii (strain LCB_4) TaxID=1841599 RepID=A0AAF0D201_ODILC|nr:MAG: tyrosine-type recombinase/integrase [Candidatus Odinarchaeum yellowstonii]